MGNFLQIARVKDIPLQLTPEDLMSIILSSTFRFWSVTIVSFDLTIPSADPPRSTVPGSIMPFNVGVSPPPQTAPEILQASRQHAVLPCLRYPLGRGVVNRQIT